MDALLNLDGLILLNPFRDQYTGYFGRSALLLNRIYSSRCESPKNAGGFKPFSHSATCLFNLRTSAGFSLARCCFSSPLLPRSNRKVVSPFIHNFFPSALMAAYAFMSWFLQNKISCGAPFFLPVRKGMRLTPSKGFFVTTVFCKLPRAVAKISSDMTGFS